MNDINPSLKKDLTDPRVRFAAERTLLAWIRTGLAMMGFGFVVARFALFLKEVTEVSKVFPLKDSQSANTSLYIGTALICLGVLVNLNAAREHLAWIKLNPDSTAVGKIPTGILTACVLGVIGILTAIRLLETT